MRRRGTPVSREALYEVVWTAAVTVVAPRYGLSDVGLVKTCMRLGVPAYPHYIHNMDRWRIQEHQGIELMLRLNDMTMKDVEIVEFPYPDDWYDKPEMVGPPMDNASELWLKRDHKRDLAFRPLETALEKGSSTRSIRKRAILAEVGLELSLFDNPDNLLSYAARGRLMAHCAERTGCQHLGLLVGQRAGLQSLGLVGSLAKYSPDAGTALRSLVRFFHHHTRGATATLTVDGQLAYFGYRIDQPGIEGADQVEDGALAAMLNIMRSLCGPGWKPSQVIVAHRKPDKVEPFRQLFHAPVMERPA